MRPSNALWTVALPCTLLRSVLAQNYTSSAKRGLVFIPNSEYPDDNQIWIGTGSDLTWYYNYGVQPSPVFANDASFDFVPMLWGAPSTTNDTTFLDSVQTLISSGTNITYVMSFNEPDGTTATGGSDVDPTLAATTWIRELEPLRDLGVKLGAPAVTGAPSGFTWLTNFFNACNGSCTADFMPVHWYGNFDGLTSNIGQKRAAYPNLTMWITEYALDNSPLNDTQSFFNSSADFFDRIDYITHYSYFGSFRSSASNVGPNVAMLDQKGQLTDIGSWYLGGRETNNVPKSDGVSISVGGAWALLVVGVCFCVL